MPFAPSAGNNDYACLEHRRAKSLLYFLCHRTLDSFCEVSTRSVSRCLQDVLRTDCACLHNERYGLVSCDSIFHFIFISKDSQEALSRQCGRHRTGIFVGGDDWTISALTDGPIRKQPRTSPSPSPMRPIYLHATSRYPSTPCYPLQIAYEPT